MSHCALKINQLVANWIPWFTALTTQMGRVAMMERTVACKPRDFGAILTHNAMRMMGKSAVRKRMGNGVPISLLAVTTTRIAVGTKI